MSDLETWLERLGLSKYHAAFTENEVEFSDLPDLTEDDLKELGLPVGPRRRLMTAVERLGAAANSGEGRGRETTGADLSSPNQQPAEAERRQLTVMFVDLVGSTALSGRLDPEDLRALMRRYQAAVAGAIGVSGGYLANWLGDGAIAYFGWPAAREDQAVEAVRAGLAAIAAVSEIPVEDGSGERLAARVGIATGLVVVGDLEQGSIGQHGMVTGETPNLASRLEGVAPTGGLAIDRTTRALTTPAFDLEFLGAQDLKGFKAPVDAWLVRAERAAESRFAAPGVRLTAFTGRTHEVGLLLDRWRRVQDSEGQVVLISGEPGIGKSRIVQTFRDRIDGDAHRRILYQCSPHHVNSALYPAIRQLERAADLTAGDAPDAKLDRIEALLRQATPEIREVAPLIAALLSIPFEARYGALDMSPQQQRVATLKALGDQLLGLARDEPVLFVLEDAHWIDPTTQELIVETVPRLVDRRVLMLITHRPEWRDPFHGQGHVSNLDMARLSRAQIGAMVRNVAGRDLPDEVVARIVERTDGIPLFVEELTKAMAEAGFDLADEDVPVTLQASLMARLDRLGPAKEIAQIGAVIGREFRRELVARAAEGRSGDLTASLDRLVDSQLIIRTRHDASEVYTFKHALIQDVAYESLLRQRRQALHLAIAESLSGGDDPEAAPEVLARHFELGNDLNNALRWLDKASVAAAQRSAQPEAIAHCTNALRILRTIGDQGDGGKLELALLLRLGQAQFGVFGGGAPEAIATFERAGILAARRHESDVRVIAQYGQYVGHMLTGQLRQADELGRQVIAVAEETGLEWIDLVGIRLMGAARSLMGDLAGAHEMLRRFTESDEGILKEIPTGFAHSPVSTAPSMLAHLEWALGNREAALTRSADSIARAAGTRTDANSLAYALTWDTLLAAFDRNPERVQASATRLLDYTRTTGGAFWRNLAQWGLGTAEILSGDASAGLPLVAAGIDGFIATGGFQHIPYMQLSLAEAQP
jgi:class 3 adenylate cyclase